MRKIALYGFGAYGKRTAESFRFYWGNEFVVTAIFDKSMCGQKDCFWDIQVLSPEQMKEKYENGLYESVMICLNDLDAWRSVRKWIEDLKIPVFFPGKEEDFAGPEFFSQIEEPEITVCEDNYNFHVFKNMLGALADADGTRLFLFNEEGRVYIDNFKKYYEYFKPYLLSYPFRLRDPIPEKVFMKGSYCVIEKTYSCNYFHFTIEAVDCIYLMEKAGYQGKYIYDEKKFSREMLEIMGIRSERLVSTKELVGHKVYIFERLYDINQFGFGPMESSTKVLPEMADSVKKSISNYPPKIYVKRTGVRKLLNGEEIAVKNGFTVIIPEEHCLREQMKLFYHADIVLAPHGASNTNCLYMHKGAIFVELLSDHWHAQMNTQICEASGIHYLQLVGKACENDQPDQEKDFTVEEADLQNMIENAEMILAKEKAKRPV